MDGDQLHDMQSQNTIFLLKIFLTKKTKDSFLLFNFFSVFLSCRSNP
jgi:hypothetical protein